MKSLWIDAHAKAFANRQHVRESSVQSRRIKVYEREDFRSDRDFGRIGSFQRIKFWRKIYDRDVEYDTVYGLDGRFISSQTMSDAEKVFLINTSLVWRDLFCYKMNYLHPTETSNNLNLKIPPEIIKTIFSHFVRPSSDSPSILNVHLSGSNFEGLDVPPTIKDIQFDESGHSVALIDQCDVDAMVVIGEISLSSDDAAEETPADGRVEIENTSHGYLRIRLSEQFLKENSEKLAHCIKSKYLRNNYFETFYNEARTAFEKATVCQEEATPASLVTVGIHGPALNISAKVISSMTEGNQTRYLLIDLDCVFALKLPTWPSVANEWPIRHRQFGWPSGDLIERITSYGSYVVATPHDFSDRPDVEFRFSFSVAEQLLAEELSFEQKQCYVSFKSAIKHVKTELESEIQAEIKVKSYLLKNVFFWVCETIPADEFQSASGWTKCFLFLIDQLLYCLREKVLPGYFIPQYNLLDAVSADVLDRLAVKVSALSRDPFSTITRFLNTLVLYNGLQLNEVLTTRTAITDMRWGLELLQNLVFAFGEHPKCRFWKKSCALELFSNWCKSHLSSSQGQCISPTMTLFDIVYLDIAHQFDLDFSVLKEFSDRETSADVVCKLASCYAEAGNGASYRDSYSEKAMLLFSLSAEKNPSFVNTIAHAAFLYDLARHDEALAILRSVTQQDPESQSENIFEDVQKMNFLMEDIGEEIEELTKCGIKYLPAVVPIYHLLLKCYRQLNLQAAEDNLFQEFEVFCVSLEKSHSHLSWYLLGISLRRVDRISHANECLKQAVSSKLQRDIRPELVLPNYYGRCPHAMISVQFVFFMFSIVMPEVGTPALLKATLEEYQMLLYNMPFTGSNLSKLVFLLINTQWLPAEDRTDRIGLNMIGACIIRWSAMSNSPTLSNKLYYAQFLMNCTTGNPALPLLLEVIEKAKKNLMSVIVWPKRLRLSVDDHIRRELDSIADDDCIVIPTSVYAQYLLATLYLRLKQLDKYTNVMYEFQSICQDCESVYPLSYSLLGHAYEQSGRYAQAVTSHKAARELLQSNALTRRNLYSAVALEQANTPIRQSTSSDKTRSIQEMGSEAMWQMCAGSLSLMPDLGITDTSAELMNIFETGRTTDECYGCRFAE